MKIVKEMNYFYYKMAMYELQVMNESDYYNGLSYNSMLYINVISQIPNCTVSKLAELLHITKSAVTLKINELVKNGAIEKIQSEDDKRVFYVRQSMQMKKTIALYDQVFMKIEKEIEKKYTSEQLSIFNEILHDIANYQWREIKNE